MGSDNWMSVPLGAVCTKIGSGATPRGGSSVYLDHGAYGLIRSQNIYNDGFHRHGLAFIGEEQANELENVEVLPDDVLLNITGDSVARCCQADSSVLPARVNQHVAIIRPDPEKLDPRFLRYFLVSPDIQARLLSWAGAGATRNALTKAMIENFEVMAPKKISEQRSIARILGTLDDKIELNRRRNETLEGIVQAIFKSWFIDFDPVRTKMEGRKPYGMDAATTALFSDSFEDSELGEIPKGWDVKPLPDAIDVNPFRPLRKGETAPYLDMANMPKRSARALSVFDREFGSGTKFMDGDTLVACITPCLENGKTAFVDFLGPDKVGWGSTEYIVLRPKPPLPPEYAYFLARSDSFRSFAIANMSGTSGRQRVPANCFDHFQICVPPASLAKRFGEFAGNFLTKMKANDEESHTLAALRDALLPKLLSGGIRVANIQPEAEKSAADYNSVPPRKSFQVQVQIKHRGRGKPLPYPQ